MNIGLAGFEKNHLRNPIFRKIALMVEGFGCSLGMRVWSHATETIGTPVGKTVLEEGGART